MEKRTGILITIIDNDGVFRYRMKTCLFTPERASHRKNPVCRSGFCAECIQNCRYEMNKKCLAVAEPFLSVCWKGVTQLVIPLEENGVHYGMLYAGTWRTRKAKKPTGMPKDFYRFQKIADSQEKRSGISDCTPGYLCRWYSFVFEKESCPEQFCGFQKSQDHGLYQ
ncbi:MAG: hypothetical protein V8T87_07345 [Victivallales bacterium]